MASTRFLVQAVFFIGRAAAAPEELADFPWPNSSLTHDEEDDFFWGVRAKVLRARAPGCSGCAHGPEGYQTCLNRIRWLMTQEHKDCDTARRIVAQEDCPGACSACDERACSDNTNINPRPAFVNPETTANGEGYIFAVGDWGNGDPDFTMHWKCHARIYSPQNPECQPGTPQWQRDSDAQFNVAAQMLKRAETLQPQAFINTGDNIYVDGLNAVNDPKMTKVFEDRYPNKEFQVPWLSVLGNHDWGGHACYFDEGRNRLVRGYHQIEYDTEPDWEWPNQKKRRWVLPDTVYKKRITFGPVSIDIFGFDSNFARPEENCGQVGFGQPCAPHLMGRCYGFIEATKQKSIKFINEELAKSDATWKIVFAHHPSGNIRGRWGDFIDVLNRHKVAIYLAGHSHNLQRLYHGGVVELVTGAGGGAIQDNLPYGFTILHFTKDKLDYSFVDDFGNDMRGLSGTINNPNAEQTVV